jgi:hypothetical protein
MFWYYTLFYQYVDTLLSADESSVRLLVTGAGEDYLSILHVLVPSSREVLILSAPQPEVSTSSQLSISTDY